MAQRTCSVEGCERKYLARGLCGTHYSSQRKSGELVPLDLTPEDRFWVKVNKDGPIPEYKPELGSCWIWTGAKHKGYGSVRIDGVGFGTHRVSYEWCIGPIPEGLHVDHLCRVRACVRPSHLEAVTQSENNRRAAEAQTHCKQGHPFTPDNFFLRQGRWRVCKQCNRDNVRRVNARKRAEKERAA